MKPRRVSFTFRRRRRLLFFRCILLFLFLWTVHTVIHYYAGCSESHVISNFCIGFSIPSLFFSLANPFLGSSKFATHDPNEAETRTITQDSWSTHPITRLMSVAENRFRTKLESQSKSLEAAVAEYRRRFCMSPPKGFDKWWEFTQQYDIIMIDEYDGMMRDLQPFYDVKGGGQEIRKRIAAVASLPSIDLVRIRGGVPSVQADGYVDTEVSARAKGLRSMLGKFVKELPDMDFPINAKAEGRVIVPWEKRQENNSVNNNNNDNNNNTRVDPLASFKPDWKGEGNVWDAWRRTCPPNTKARRYFSSVRSGMYTMDNELLSLPTSTTPQFTFSPNTPYHDQSFCDDPHLHYTQGHFFSDWRTLGELYPVMSPARASGFSDIKIPSHYYYGSTARYTYGWDAEKGELREVDKDEVAWDTVENDATNGNDSNSLHKLNKIFWRGATTGGGNEPAGFAPMYQRHRAVRDLASDFNALVQGVELTGFDAYHDGGLYHLSVPYSTLNKGIMDIAFMQATSPGQYPGGLKKLLNDYRFDEGVPLGHHWKYKYLLDIDGMSYSGRFMAFLASDSVPIKSTVYEEFFGDWIEPWLHYIPLSAGYEEIYNIFAYFSGIPGEVVEQVYNDSDTYDYEGDNDSAPDGDARLHRIALAGKQWKKTIGRTVDMEAYVYRLALEWARLCSDDREVMSYVV
ncbi:hypothetical protein J3R30DRAFT_3284166 [Lentinula aciculospora]|uniref:Glycosyl transferase CAP10 domain-containing protein n=1 Tax=Lentinula aciculospora TaxID=153920 RepID=A0A9W9AJ99_9AGAR|nr:hypothetical protein J3R30DRAFT_3284166 [Lentinula aciculospora]